jgi:hypothetical protein
MKLRAVLFIIVGLMLLIPFMYLVFWAEYSFHSMTILAILSLIGSLVGGPLFFVGFIILLMPVGGSSSPSSQDIELSRIRYATESIARGKRNE